MSLRKNKIDILKKKNYSPPHRNGTRFEKEYESNYNYQESRDERVFVLRTFFPFQTRHDSLDR